MRSRRGQAGGVGYRMRGFDDLDALARHRVAVAGDDQSAQRRRASASSTACAIAAEALPAPMTISRPRGAAGRCGGMHSAGCAAAIAASNICRSNCGA